MNFNILKLGFQAYIQDKLEKNGSESAAVANSDISIFMYADEFKEYVSQELPTNTDISNMSISDILDMEIVNGKLMTDEEAAEAEKALEGFDSEEESAETTENTQTTDATETDATTDGQAAVPAPANAEQPQQPQTVNGDAATEQQLLFQGIINNLMQTEEVKNVVDTDGNSEVSEEEMTAFLEAVGAQDGDATNLTLDDIFSAINGIKDNTFKLNAEETTATEKVEDTAPEVEDVAPSSPSSQSSNSGFTGGNGSGDFSFNPSSSSSTPQEKNVSNMSLDELKNELSTTESNVGEQEQALDAALNGTSETLTDLQSKIDESFEAYKEALGSELAKELEDIETRLSDKEAELVENDQAIWDQENKIAECETSYENAQATTAAIEGQIGSLESALSGLDDSEESAARRAEIEAKIGELQQKKTEAEQAEKDALDALNDAKDALEGENGLLKQKEKLEEELKGIEQEKTEFEAKLPEEDQAIQEAKTNYETAKQEFKTQQAQEVIAAREEVKASKDYINELNSAINTKENEQLKKDYSVTASSMYDAEEGQKLVDAAYTMLSRYGSSTGYCATGVSRTMSIAYGIQMGGHGYQWDTNMDKLVDEGMFAEVTDDYATSADLANLPAGAVVCWENTSNSGGGGKQYGHVCIADGKGGEISDHYQANIYKSIGGRSDQYRVFIPV